MSISRAKTRSIQSQTCVKKRGILIGIKKNKDVNTGDLKILQTKLQKKTTFHDVTFNFSKNCVFCLQPYA